MLALGEFSADVRMEIQAGKGIDAGTATAHFKGVDTEYGALMSGGTAVLPNLSQDV